MKRQFSVLAVLWLSACSEGALNGNGPLMSASTDASVSDVRADLSASRGPGFAPPVRPILDLAQTRPDFPPPPSSSARTVEEFDTTSAQDRAEAIAAPSGGERLLGATIASLGSPTDPGIWFKTPLVRDVTQGRVEFNGKSVNVELRPSGGEQGAGSQISLAAMRLIEAPLTSLPEVRVYAN